MKGAGKIIMIVTMATSSLLLYVHLNVSLFHVSYDLNTKSQMLTQKGEQYRHLKFEVDRLKAPRRLEKKIEELSLDLTLPKDIEVVRVAKDNFLNNSHVEVIEHDPIQNRFMNFFGRWIGTAQANTE